MKPFLLVGETKEIPRPEDVEDVELFLLSIVHSIVVECIGTQPLSFESPAQIAADSIKLVKALVNEPKAIQALHHMGEVEYFEGGLESTVALRTLLRKAVSLITDDTSWISVSPSTFGQCNIIKDILDIDVEDGVAELIERQIPIKGMVWISEPDEDGDQILMVLPAE